MATCLRSRYRDIQSKLERSTPALIQEWVPAELIEEVVAELKIKFRRRVFTPVATLWLWLSQVFSADGSCRRTVAKAFGWLLREGEGRCSTDCSAYSRARNRLAEPLPELVAKKIAEDLATEAADQVFGRKIKLFDGTTCTAADTPENQEAYPQPSGQKKGCGFPMVRLVGMFDLLTGAFQALRFGSLKDSEHKLFRQLWDELEPGDIAVADSLFNSYVHIVQLMRRGVEVLFRQDGRRKFDFRKGQRLGSKDALFTLHRPPPSQRPKWMSKAEYLAEIPETLVVRVLEYTVTTPGFRSRKIRLITTLLEPAEFTREALVELYARRWRIELDFRDIKITLEMDFLNVQSPAMIRKEIWMHMLGYNVARKVIWETSAQYGRALEELSFKGALQLMEEVAGSIGSQPEKATREAYEELLRGIHQRPVRPRPNRSEPRVLKRRHKDYRYMTRPRRKSEPRKRLRA